MAFWHRRKDGRIFVFTYRTGKQEQVKPRSWYSHLDKEPNHNVEAWVRKYEEQYEGKALAPEQHIPPRLRRLVDDYVAHLAERGKDQKTQADHQRMLHSYILPYFIGTHGLEDPNDWPKVSAKMTSHLREHGQSEHQILRCNSAIRGFWEFLCDEQQILGGLAIRVRAPIRRAEETPLPRVVYPDEALKWARSCAHPQVKLMGLLGYFFSLRPQETFAMRRRDFRAGSQAAALECCKVMAQRELFDRMAVEVSRQRTQSGDFEPPKAYSKGWVACFNREAAELLVAELKKVEDPEKLLFEFLPDWNYELWKRHGIKGITLKDLRRTSLYWLGHYTKMSELVPLHNHARHKKPETTMLYLRRPGEELGEKLDLDLDA